MQYLSTTEIAKKWGVSRKTVTRYAEAGRIPGAYLVGNTWMIPENAKKEDAVIAADTDSKEHEFHFPLYIYRDFFKLKETLKTPQEQKLYAAFEAVLEGDFSGSYALASESEALTEDFPIRITCLYVMARCALYQNQYSLFMKHSLELNRLFTEDFEHKEEMRTLLIDLEGYYKGFDSLLNASFREINDYSSELFPLITTMTLYKQILMYFEKKQEIDTTVYEMSIKLFVNKGYIYPAILLSEELSLVFYNQMNYRQSNQYAKYAYELAEKYQGFFLLTELYAYIPKVLDKALKYYNITMNPALKKMTKDFRRSYIGLMLYLKKPKSIFSVGNDDYDYLFYAVNNYTNKEIAQEKGISENAVSQRYAKLYQFFSVDSKKELIQAFLSSLEHFAE